MKYFFTYLVGIFFIISHAFAVVQPAKAPEQQTFKPTVSVEMFSLFMAVQDTLPSDEVKAFWQEINGFTAALQQKKERYKNEEAFLKHLFYKVHRKYLKKYGGYTTFYDLFNDGSYDCVTGTALYALLLDALQWEYQIRETPYHVFLVVYLHEKQDSVLFEATDPHGFVTNQKSIEKAMALYQQPPSQEVEEASFDYQFRIDERISLQKLAGLSYFNQAVDHYNHQRLPKAIQYLQQAMVLYPARRMEAFQSLLHQTAQKLSYSY